MANVKIDARQSSYDAEQSAPPDGGLNQKNHGKILSGPVESPCWARFSGQDRSFRFFFFFFFTVSPLAVNDPAGLLNFFAPAFLPPDWPPLR